MELIAIDKEKGFRVSSDVEDKTGDRLYYLERIWKPGIYRGIVTNWAVADVSLSQL